MLPQQTPLGQIISLSYHGRSVMRPACRAIGDARRRTLLEPSWNYLFFLGGDFGFPASLRFFLHVPSSLRARGSLPTYGPCLEPALRSAISRSSYPLLFTCIALARRSYPPVLTEAAVKNKRCFLPTRRCELCDRRCLRLGCRTTGIGALADVEILGRQIIAAVEIPVDLAECSVGCPHGSGRPAENVSISPVSCGTSGTEPAHRYFHLT